MEKHIGSRMKKKPELIGGKTCARGTVRQQMVLVLLDHKFHCSPAGLTRLIDESAIPVLQISDDETGIRSKGIIFDFGFYRNLVLTLAVLYSLFCPIFPL